MWVFALAVAPYTRDQSNCSARSATFGAKERPTGADDFTQLGAAADLEDGVAALAIRDLDLNLSVGINTRLITRAITTCGRASRTVRGRGRA